MTSSSNALTSLFAHLQEASELGNSLDFVVFQSILICLVAREKNLILRAHPDDIPLVAKVAVLTLSSVFGISCRHLKIKQRLQVDDSSIDQDGLLRSLLISSHTDDFEKVRPKKTKRRQRSRSKSVTRYHRSKSYSSAEASPPITGDLHQSVGSDFFRDQRRSASEQSYQGRNLPGNISQRPLSGNVASHPLSNFDLPGAIVLSGLENASLPSQRSLDHAFAERKVILNLDPDRQSLAFPNGPELNGDDERAYIEGTWPFPSDFIAIYVAPVDDYTKPAILGSLLDKFALSANIGISAFTRQLVEPIARSPSARPHSSSQPSMSIPSNHDHSVAPAVLRPIAKRHSELTKSQPVFSPDVLEYLRTVCSEVSIHPRLSVHIKDLFSAVRHFHALDGTLLSARSLNDMCSLVRAIRTLHPDSNGMEFLRNPLGDADDTASSLNSGSGTAKPGSTNIEHGKSPNDLDEIGRVYDAFFKLKEATSLEATRRDVALIFPRVVSHRVSVRSKPSDEVLSSAILGAARGTGVSGEGQFSDTVKSLLVRIIKEV